MRGIIDGHIHVTEELLPVLRKNCVYCIANSDNLQEYEILKCAKIPQMAISAGIHPWKADVTDWKIMEPILQKANVIGEIGLDNVWCQVDMEIQRKVFLQQLELAVQLQKPVILHTKGMEKEILEMIRQFPNRYLVHWYSCENYLEKYIQMGCWFTVGPAVLQDKAVEAVARKVPSDRLLIESDGIDGISWGLGREVGVSNYIEAMEAHLYAVAELRGCESEKLWKQMRKNLKDFIKH